MLCEISFPFIKRSNQVKQYNSNKFKYNKVLTALICCFPFLSYAKEQHIDKPNGESTQDTIMVSVSDLPLLNKDGVRDINIDDDIPNDFGSIIRYQTLISAPNASQGASSSGFDRGGYKGYNIRGLEGNRVAIDVNGIPLPDATSRSYGSRSGKDTFGIGRDYVDPYMYRQLVIDSGTSSATKSNGTIGGSVSFLSKTANDYLTTDKTTYVGYQTGYNSTNKGFHNGLTFAGKDGEFDGLLVLSRRDYKESKINNDITPYPNVSHSNAVLLRGGWQANPEHLFVTTFDYYSRSSRDDYAYWKINRNPALNTKIDAKQKGETKRYSYDLAYNWSPSSPYFDGIDSRLFYQRTKANDKSIIFDSLPPYQLVDSAFNTDVFGFESKSGFQTNLQHITFGISGLISSTERPFWQENLSNPRDAIMQPEADSKRYRMEAFVKDQFNFSLHNNLLTVEPGLRLIYQKTKAVHLDKMSSSVVTEQDLETLYGKTHSDHFLSPSLLINYQLADGANIYAKYQRGIQFPNAGQLYGSWNLNQNGLPPTLQYAFIGNIDLEPETSHAFEIGYTGDITAGIEVGASLFYNKYKNFIASNRYNRLTHPDMFDRVPSHIGTIFKTENRDAAYIYGLEFNTKIDFSVWSETLSGFDTVIAIGYSKGKSKSSYSGDEYVDLESIAPLKAVIGLNWNSPQKDYGASIVTTLQKGKQAKDSGRENYNNTSSSVLAPAVTYYRIPGYGMIDLSAYWQITKTVRVNGGIYNLTDKRYWNYSNSHSLTQSGYPSDKENFLLSTQPGRTFYLGMNIDF